MNTTPDLVPTDVAATVQRAAQAVPAHAGDLDTVRSRGRTRRHRRTAGAGLLAVAAAAALAAPFVLQEPAGEIPPLVAPAGPAQRLLLNGEGWTTMRGEDIAEPEVDSSRELYEFYRDRPGVNGLFSPVGEILPDGQVIELDSDLPGISGMNEIADMPGGRLAVLGYTDPAPDGPCFEGVTLRLLVVGADGSVEQSREAPCGSTLVAADADAAYLVRGESRLVRHDLGTGEEEPLLESPGLIGPPGSGGVSFAGGRLVRSYAEVGDALCAVDGPQAAVRIEVAEIASGETAEYGVPGEGCREPADVRVSPDGRYAALAYYSYRGEGEVEVGELETAVVDLDSGAVVQTWAGDARGEEKGVERIVDLAWDDEQTLLAAWYEQPSEGVHWLPDILRVETVVLP